MSESPVSISINGITGGQNNIGSTTIAGDQVQNNVSERMPTVPEVLDVVQKALPEITPDVIPSMEIAEAAEAVSELRTMAAMPIAEQDTPTMKEKATALLNSLIPYAPQIGKGLATFGAAALSTLAMRNPIIAGVLALCEANKAA